MAPCSTPYACNGFTGRDLAHGPTKRIGESVRREGLEGCRSGIDLVAIESSAWPLQTEPHLDTETDNSIGHYRKTDMHDKRYSIFISSTFEDLRAERQAVQDVVIGAGDFPVQMESFPAADEDQFEFIKALIDKCDYYVLVVAGRYGALADDGMSYTEKEYRYAVSKGIPILAMLHGDRGSISANKSEDSADGKKRLDAFIAAVETNRLRKTWTTTNGLKHAFLNTPRRQGRRWAGYEETPLPV